MKKQMRGLLFSLLALVAMSSMMSCERIDAGHVGLQVNYYGSDKGVSDVTEVTGLVFYAPWSSYIVETPTYVQTKDYEAFAVTAKGGSKFMIDPTLSYNVVAHKAGHVFRTYRKELPELENGVIRTMVYNAYRDVTNRYLPDELINNREKFETEVKSILEAQMDSAGFLITDITSQIVPPKSLEDAIDEKNKAVQTALTAENKVKTAEANAKIAVAEAEGRARAKLIDATAEADANRKVASSLTPALVQWKQIDRWDGKYPTTVAGGSGTSFLISPK